MPRPREEQKHNFCGNCYFWQQEDVLDDGTAVGTCRINPPLLGSEFSNAEWPHTHTSDWCGAYRRGITAKPVEE